MTATSLSRRRFLQAGGATAAVAVSPLVGSGVAGASTARDTLVLVMLRGGVDGLSVVVPAGDKAYALNRQSTRLPESSLIGLDSRFGLNGAMSALGDHYRNGHLALVVGAGNPSESRSHFDQQAALELGTPNRTTTPTGWLARHLATVPGSGALRGVSQGYRLAASLRGAPRSAAIESVDGFSLTGVSEDRAARDLSALVRAAGDGPFGRAADDAVAVMRLIKRSHTADVGARNGATYEQHPWATSFQQVAQLIHAGIGLEVATIDLGGWDTHDGQGGASGPLSANLRTLGNALGAFYQDLADRRDRLTVVVVSEFGRRVAENHSGGTDHGRGGIAMVLGGHIRGGRVYGTWHGLGAGELDDGDVPVTTDLRDVLGEVVQRRLGNSHLDHVFPGHRVRPLGLTR